MFYFPLSCMHFVSLMSGAEVALHRSGELLCTDNGSDGPSGDVLFPIGNRDFHLVL